GHAIGEPPAIVLPVFQLPTPENQSGGIRIVQSGTRAPAGCFVARLDQGYLRASLFPQLIRQSFGETDASEYDFAVVPRDLTDRALYGTLLRPDLRKPFFTILPGRALSHRPPTPGPGVRQTAV